MFKLYWLSNHCNEWVPEYGYTFNTRAEAKRYALDELKYLRADNQQEKFKVVKVK